MQYHFWKTSESLDWSIESRSGVVVTMFVTFVSCKTPRSIFLPVPVPVGADIEVRLGTRTMYGGGLI
jgi:hypothetical protein